MTTERITPKCFIEHTKHIYHFAYPMSCLDFNLSGTIKLNLTTIAIFLIQPATTSLKERMEARNRSINMLLPF